MILRIIVVIRVGVEELEGVGLGSCGTNEFGRIDAELIGIHHIDSLRQEFEATTDAEVDTCCHRLVALGFNHHHAVGCLGTIDGSTVLQHGNLLDVLNHDVGKDVVEEAVVERRTGELHVLRHTVDDDERLGIGVE